MKCVYLTMLLVIFQPVQFVISATIRYGIDETDGSSLPKKLVMPAMAKKAGGSWRPELLSGASDKQPEEQTNEPSYNEDYEDYYEDDEIDCPRSMFFHVRSKMCVPFKCPQDTKRDKESGQCIEQYFNLYRRNYRPRLYVYRRGPLVRYRNKFALGRGIG